MREVEELPLKYKDWKVEDGCLYRLRIDPLLYPVENREKRWKLMVPVEYREVLQQAHCTPSSGHLGIEKT